MRISPKKLQFDSYPTAVASQSAVMPKAILIPSIKSALPIIPSIVTNGHWGTTDKGVSYLTSSPIPGEAGNSIMYGHNWTSILGHLSLVKPGDMVIVLMSDGKKKEFKVEYTATVSPNQTYIIDTTKDARLTIYTCIGFLDSKRFVVVAKPAV